MVRRVVLSVGLILWCLLPLGAPAMGGQATAAGPYLVHYCDLHGECHQSHEVLRSTGSVLPVHMATIAESVRASVELQLTDLPATVLYRDGAPAGAVVGHRRPGVLQDELSRLELAVRGAGLPTRAAAARTTAPSDDGLVVYVEMIVRAGRIHIVDTEIFEGAAPKPYASRVDSHHVQLLDDADTPLETRAWQPVSIVVPPPPQPGQEEGPPASPIRRIAYRTAVVLPYRPGATSVRVEQPFGLEAARAELDAPPAARRQSRTATPIYNTGPDARRLVLLIMGDKYKGAAKKQIIEDAQDVADYTMTIDPFSKQKKNVNIYRSKTRNGLKCYYELALDGEDSRSILCNDAKVFKKAARDKIEYDEILVLVNSEKYGGSAHAAVGGGGSESYSRSYNQIGRENLIEPYGWGREVSVHELGHSFFGLMDEYDYGIAGTPWGPNCQAPPCTWTGSGLGCFEGCSYTGLARPTDRDCGMNILDPPGGFHFCSVGLTQAKTVLRRY